MKKIEPGDPETRSADIVAGNIEQIKALFPEAVTEGRIDFEVLKQVLGEAIDDKNEKYGLNWHGKKRARQLALTPSNGTLRPCPEESVDWDTTQNIFIEGDNLEVLKLLQKSYAGKVKLIYIDPPYNTGKDFVYKDDYRDNIKNYLMLTGQIDSDGRKISSNTESSGRFHTDWLNMMYARLKVAAELLTRDGVIFISIDDAEAPNLRGMCDEVLGEENFIAQMVWEGANKNDARQIGVSHEYVVVYGRDRSRLPSEWSLTKEGVDSVLKEVASLRRVHGTDFDAASDDLAGWFRAMKAKPAFAHRRFRFIDARGAYKEDDPTAPGGRKFDLVHPDTGEVIPLRKNRGWAFDQEEFNRLVADGRISFVTPTSVMVRRYLHETDAATPQSVFYQPARSASERLSKLLGPGVFDFPKDERVIQKIVEMATTRNGDIVLDFFAGSGTTGQAVLDQNSVDGGTRRFVLVQLPEPLLPDVEEQAAAAAFCDSLGIPRHVAELTKVRLKRVAAERTNQQGMTVGDVGFRVFKLASTNIRAWDPRHKELAASLEASVEHIQNDRKEADVVYELLLKLGIDLCVAIEARQIAGASIHAIGGGVLIACLAEQITRGDAEPLALGIAAWHKELAPAGETTIVFRDSAFEDDVAKTNVAAVLEQHGLANVKSL